MAVDAITCMFHLLTRYLLAPLLPAALIAAPLASLMSANSTLTWDGAFTGLTIVLCSGWAAARLREDRRNRVHSKLSDPCFGSLERREGGLWWGSVVLENHPGLLPISIEAGPKGPSEEQRERFQFLRHAVGDLDGPLRASLERAVAAPQDASEARLISLELLPEGEGPAFMTTWSLGSEGGSSDVFNIPLSAQASDTTSKCGSASELRDAPGPDLRSAG
ncbi:MAG: hypothetical protein ACI8QC_002842 [Planctomycetota bacterium]|jgi:hypothetical protein